MQDFMIHTWSATLRTITLEVNGTLFIPRQHQNNPEENQFRVTIFASDVFFATYPNILNSMSVGRTQMNWNISFRDDESYCVIVDQVTLRTCRSLFLHEKKFLVAEQQQQLGRSSPGRVHVLLVTRKFFVQ